MSIGGPSIEMLESRRLLATLSGNVFDDLNGNARRDTGEPGLANQRIFIDLNFNDRRDRGEPSVLSDSNGNFRFLNRQPGIQRLRYEVPSGRRLSAPTRIFYDVPVAFSNVANLNFGSTTTGVLVGTVFGDFNGNGRREISDIGLAGWTVFLDRDNDGRLDANEQRRVSDRSGVFRFAGLTSGTYVVRIVQQDGFTRTNPLNGLFRVSVSPGGSVSNLNFGQRPIS